MEAEKNWQVTRYCCLSALCMDCRARGALGDLDRRSRVVHIDGVTQARAQVIAAGWSKGFGARAEPMQEVAA